jgi:hypothetical protein
MNSRILGQIGLGLLGVWALVQVLFGVVVLVGAITTFQEASGSSRSGLLMIGLPVAALLGLSYVLLFHSASVAHLLFPDVDAAADAARADLPPVLVGLLGVLFVGMATPSVIRALFTFVPSDPYLSREILRSRLRDIAGYGLEAALGVFLVLRPRRVLALWQSPPSDRAA